MLKKLFLSFLLVTFMQSICRSQVVAQSDTSKYDHLIGQNRDSLSSHLQTDRKFGGVIGDENSTSESPQFLISILKLKSTYLVLFLENKGQNKKSNFIIRDQILLDIPEEEYSIAAQMCSKNDKRDSSIFAVAKNSGTTYLTDIIEAWKIDFDRKNIHAINTGEIKCERMFSVN